MIIGYSFLYPPPISLFLYLDNWLIRDPIRNRLVSHTMYCLQTVQSLGFILNLKKSDWIQAQKFTFIGMEFLTQQNIVRVPADCIESLFLTIKLFLSQTQVSARTFLSLLGKLIAAADFVLLGRLHLRLLQMSLICLETSYSSSQSSGFDQQYDSISFEMVDGHQSLRSGNVHSFSRSQCIPFYGCQSLLMGSSSRVMRLAFHGRWSEDQSQLYINMLEIMAICLALKKAIKYIHHSCVLISTVNTTVVSYINKQGEHIPPTYAWRYGKSSIGAWNTILLSEFVIIQANSIYWQIVFRDWIDLSKQNGLWINQWRIPFYKCSI